jgi:F-type H+-transporting ATPase subunit epsilon
MADTVEFELVSPERLLMSEPVEMVVVPGVEGDFGVLPGHSLLISAVRPGVIAIHGDGRVRERIFVGSGFAQVSPKHCTVLAEEAAMVGDIDRADAEARLQAAREQLAEAKETEGGDTRAAEKELQTAEAMLAAIAAQA